MHSNIALITAFAAAALAAPLSVQGRMGTVQPGQAFAPKQERQLDALTGLLEGGGATGTGSATGGAGGLDALVSVVSLSLSLSYNVLQQNLWAHTDFGNSDRPSWRCYWHGQRCGCFFLWSSRRRRWP